MTVIGDIVFPNAGTVHGVDISEIEPTVLRKTTNQTVLGKKQKLLLFVTNLVTKERNWTVIFILSFSFKDV